MTLQFARPLVALLPVLSLLAALVYLDSYKLVKLRAVVAALGCGAAVAAATYPLNEFLLGRFTMELTTFSRYVAPLSEELLKALIIAALIRGHRIGFLVDAAIFGFAVGTGFALAENLYYLHLVPEASLGTWIVRGFGTALMHGGATAIFGVMGLAMIERRPGLGARAFLPGLGLSILLHAGFNQFFVSPSISTLGILAVLPPLFYAVFSLSERSLGVWLGKGFDADTAMLELINSGRFAASPIGRYLQALKSRFAGPVVADLVCYLRLHTELSLRAKGVLMMRENGFEAPMDPATRDAFVEMRYLERSIGRTGLLTIQPMLGMSHQDLWQLYLLDK